MKHTVKAELRTDQTNKLGLAPIYISIYQGKIRVRKTSTNHRVEPSLWDNEKREILKKHPNTQITTQESVLKAHKKGF
jgi:hypothetical protein